MADEERQSIDVINFALLAFLSDRPHKANELRDLLEKYIQADLSRTPFYRRMRGLVDGGYVSEEKVDGFGTVMYTLTEKGRDFCIKWSGILQGLVDMTTYAEGMAV